MVKLQTSLLALALVAGSTLAFSDESEYYQRRNELDSNLYEREFVDSQETPFTREDHEDLFAREPVFDEFEPREPLGLGVALKVFGKVGGKLLSKKAAKGAITQSARNRFKQSTRKAFSPSTRQAVKQSTRKAVKQTGRHVANNVANNAMAQVQTQVQTRIQNRLQSRGMEQDEELFGRDLDDEELVGREYDQLDERDNFGDLD